MVVYLQIYATLSIIRSLCLIKVRHGDVWGSGETPPRILNLGTRCRWVVNFTPRPLYPREKSYHLPNMFFKFYRCPCTYFHTN